MAMLDWMGKNKIVNHHNEVKYRTLNRVYSFDENGQHEEDNNSENMIIHGDNLEALKSLLPKYEGRIKCIYIDPPYNTGNENWVYNDNVNDPRIKKWIGQVVGKEGEDLSRHDKWLCMMYPRLKLLEKLLSSDGAIFISIDDNEKYDLKMICDEIFGAGNFITEIACINNPKGRSDDKYVAIAHEAIFIYKKRELNLGEFEPEEKVIKRYREVDENGEKFRGIDLRKTGDEDLREDREEMFYPFFYNETTNELYPGNNTDKTPDGFIRILPMKTARIEGRWRWSKDGESMIQGQKDLYAGYMKKNKRWTVFEKDYLRNKEGVKPTTVWDFKDVNSERGTEIFGNLGFEKKQFNNPKPIGTIERIIKIINDKDAIILDAFAGSGTTAHSVLDMNKKDGGNRKFILIEMMDYAEDITAERAKRVIKGYGEGDKAVDGTGGAFSYYELGNYIFNENGTLSDNISIEDLRKYVYYSETKGQEPEISKNNKYYLGTHGKVDYYLYYDIDGSTTLNYEFLATIKEKQEAYVIYADRCIISEEELLNNNIIFKKIPRDVIKI